jgi:Fe-S cluster assembly protein SufD
VLTTGARADSVPNLEIETGEIAGAGHASATGRFDDEQLFYLQSRGIPEDVARRLVVRGFFGEILSKITPPELRERLEAAVEAELAITGVLTPETHPMSTLEIHGPARPIRSTRHQGDPHTRWT